MSDQQQDLRSRIAELVAMIERLRAALARIKGEDDPKAMKAVAEAELAGMPPPPEAKKK